MLPIRQHLLTLTCLKSNAKTVLIEVCELAENGKKGGCFVSNATLSTDLGMSLKTVTRTIASLEAAGLLVSNVVKAEGNRRYLVPTARLRACYCGGTEAQQLAVASNLTIVKTDPEPVLTIVKNGLDYSQNSPVTIVKNGPDYSQNGSRVLGDDQYDQKTTTDDQPLAASERAVLQKKIGDLQAEVAHLKAQLARKPGPPVAAAPPRLGYRDFTTDWPPQLRPPFDTPEFREAWARWAAYRFEIGKAFGGNISEQADLDKLQELAAGSQPKALKIISDTISANWKNSLTMTRTGPISLADALAKPPVSAPPAASKPCPPTAATEAPPQPQAPPSPPLPPPETPDEVVLLPAEAHLAIAKAKRAKHSDLYRAHHTWQLLNCDLVECDFEGGLGYVLRETSTEPEPYYPVKADDVVLTPAEMAAALAAGQRLKWGDLKFAYHSAQAKASPAAPRQVAVRFETVRSWALRQAQAVADRRQPAFDFVLDEHNRRVFELLCYYHAGDTQFEILGAAWGFGRLSLDKSIGLFGGVGRGKTILQEAFRQNPARPYGVVSTRKVGEVFHEDLTANEGKLPVVSSAQKLYRGLGDCRALCFDDVGREKSKVQHMGNWVYPMQQVILDRYEAVQRGHLPLWATHLTSNNALEPEDSVPGMPSLTELYEAAAVDRLYEMCNILTLAGPSRRN